MKSSPAAADDVVVAVPAVDLLDVAQRRAVAEVERVVAAAALHDVVAVAAVDGLDARAGCRGCR